MEKINLSHQLKNILSKPNYCYRNYREKFYHELHFLLSYAAINIFLINNYGTGRMDRRKKEKQDISVVSTGNFNFFFLTNFTWSKPPFSVKSPFIITLFNVNPIWFVVIYHWRVASKEIFLVPESNHNLQLADCQ